MSKSQKNQYLAAIDVGSHALGMKIVEYSRNKEITTLENVKKAISLGRDTFAMGKVSFETVSETCEILRGFRQLMQDYSIKVYRATATSAVREAGNRDYIIDQIKTKTGLSIDIIGNSEERFLNYKAIRNSMSNFNELRKEGVIIVDIGYGSIQVTLYNDDKLELSQNIRLGSLRIREVLSTLEGRTLNFPRVMDEFISSNIDNVKIFQARKTIKNLIVLGGEIRIISKLCNKNCGNQRLEYITKECFDPVYSEMLYKSSNAVSKEFKVPLESADLLLPTMMLLRRFQEITIDDKIYTPMVSLVDGVVADICEKKFEANKKDKFNEDILSSARFIAERFRYHRAHAEDVEKKSLELFDGLLKLHALGERERLLLQVAAILHDTGKFINLNEHYLNSYSIIMTSDLLGVSKEELQIIANVAMYHSGLVPLHDHANFMKLNEKTRIVVAKLVSIIRLADALDRSHRQKVKNMKISVEEDKVILKVESVEEMLLEEWTFETKAEFFEEVFGLIPVLKIKRKVGYV